MPDNTPSPELVPEPSPTPTPASAPTAQPVAKAGDDNLMAAISYLWIVSIIILLTKKDSDFVQFHAKQATVLFGFWVVLWVLSAFTWFLGLIWGLLDIVLLVVAIICFIKAYSGERYRLPIVADIADKIHI